MVLEKKKSWRLLKDVRSAVSGFNSATVLATEDDDVEALQVCSPRPPRTRRTRARTHTRRAHARTPARPSSRTRGGAVAHLSFAARARRRRPERARARARPRRRIHTL